MKNGLRSAQVGTEYALGAAAVLAVLVLMSVYVRSGLAGKWKSTAESFSADQFDPKEGSFETMSVKKGGTETLSRTEKIPTSEGYAWYMMSYQAGGPGRVWGYNETGNPEEVIKADTTRAINTEVTAKKGTLQWMDLNVTR